MYKSPIELITKPIYTKMLEEQENHVFRTIQETGVNVDKEELLKALKYDREQYNKGYMDGARDFAERLKEKENVYNADGFFQIKYIPRKEIDNILKEMGVDADV